MPKNELPLLLNQRTPLLVPYLWNALLNAQNLIAKIGFHSDLLQTNNCFVKPLTEKELSSAQIIIINEDDNNFFIQYPKNDEIKSILKNFGASWIESEYCWRLNNLIKEEIMARFQLLNIIVKKLSDKEKCKF